MYIDMNVSLPANVTFNLTNIIPPSVNKIRITCIGLWAIIVCFGVFGNCLTIVVLISPKLNNSSTTFYLTALALIDLFYLIFSLGGQMFDFAFFFPWTMRQQNLFACISLSMISYTLAYISVWLLVAVAIDRMIWVIYPFGAKTICTRNIAKIIVTILFCIFVIIDVHFIWTLEFIRHDQGFNTCNIKESSSYIFPYIDLTLIMGLPFLIMCTANVLIISKLREMERLRKQMKASNVMHNEYGNQGRNEKKITRKHKKNKTGINEDVGFEKSKRSTRRRSRDKQTTSLTKMLLSVNIFFLVSTAPLLTYNIVYFVTNIKSVIMKHEKALGGIIFGLERVMYTLWYLNYAVHFLLYCMSGPKFRQEAMRLLMKYFCGVRCFDFQQRFKSYNTRTTTNNNDSMFLKTYGFTEENRFAKDENFVEISEDRDDQVDAKLLLETNM